MQGAVSILTAAAVALHLLWGCCGHHACASPPRVEETVFVKPTCCGQHHAPPPVERECPRESDSPRDRCDHNECSFSASAPEVHSPVIAEVAVLDAVIEPCPPIAERGLAAGELLAPLPCRLHLWNGVLRL